MKDSVRVKWWRRDAMRALRRVNTIVLDIDGVLTDGNIYADASGTKLFKRFGPDDHDAIREARSRGMNVMFTSWDKRGWDISRAHVEYMGGTLIHGHTSDRAHMLRDEHGVDLGSSVYVGDGYYDHLVMKDFAVGACPSDAWPGTMRAADLIASRPGGNRAVAQIIYYILGVREEGVLA